MTISTILSNISTLNNDLTKLRKKISENHKKKSDKYSEIERIKKSITKNTSLSTLKSKDDQISRCLKTIQECEKMEADLHKKINEKGAILAKKQAELQKEHEDEQKKVVKMYQDNLKKQQQSSERLTMQLQQIKNTIETQPTQEKKFDFFISHASEDKDEVARPLCQTLTELGADVWFDDFTMTVGDNLRKSIDKGLVNSKYGIVILSETFLKKSWTSYELDALVQRQMVEEKVILPVWHKVSKDVVMQYSPSLAGLLALKTSDDTIDDIAQKLFAIIKK